MKYFLIQCLHVSSYKHQLLTETTVRLVTWFFLASLLFILEYNWILFPDVAPSIIEVSFYSNVRLIFINNSHFYPK